MLLMYLVIEGTSLYFSRSSNSFPLSFYFAFKKIEMSYFIIHLLQQKLLNPPSKDFKYHIEWVLKDYISIIESKSEYKFYSGELGVETNFKSNGWKVLSPRQYSEVVPTVIAFSLSFQVDFSVSVTNL